MKFRNPFEGFTKKGLYKVLSLILLVPLFAFSVWLGYRLLKSSEFRPREVRITNVTSNSATITWLTDMPSKSYVYVKEEDRGFLLGKFSNLVSDVFYDDRDVALEQERLLDEYVNGGDIEGISSFESIQPSVEGDYYSHSVTVFDLDPSQKYYFRIGDGFLTWKIKEVEQSVDNQDFIVANSFTINTRESLDSVEAPYPISGRVAAFDLLDDMNSGDRSDSLIFGYLLDPKSGISSMLSTTANRSGGWTLDFSNLYSNDGSLFVISDDTELRLAVNIENYESVEQGYDLEKDMVTPYILGNEEIAVAYEELYRTYGWGVDYWLFRLKNFFVKDASAREVSGIDVANDISSSGSVTEILEAVKKSKAKSIVPVAPTVNTAAGASATVSTVQGAAFANSGWAGAKASTEKSSAKVSSGLDRVGKSSDSSYTTVKKNCDGVVKLIASGAYVCDSGVSPTTTTQSNTTVKPSCYHERDGACVSGPAAYEEGGAYYVESKVKATAEENKQSSTCLVYVGGMCVAGSAAYEKGGAYYQEQEESDDLGNPETNDPKDDDTYYLPYHCGSSEVWFYGKCLPKDEDGKCDSDESFVRGACVKKTELICGDGYCVEGEECPLDCKVETEENLNNDCASDSECTEGFTCSGGTCQVDCSYEATGGWYYAYNNSCYARADTEGIFNDIAEDLDYDGEFIVVNCKNNPAEAVCQANNIWCMAYADGTIRCKEDIRTGAVETQGQVLEHELFHQLQYENEAKGGDWDASVLEWGAELNSNDVTGYLFHTPDGPKTASETVDVLKSAGCSQKDLDRIAANAPRSQISLSCQESFETYVQGFEANWVEVEGDSDTGSFLGGIVKGSYASSLEAESYYIAPEAGVYSIDGNEVFLQEAGRYSFYEDNNDVLGYQEGEDTPISYDVLEISLKEGLKTYSVELEKGINIISFDNLPVDYSGNPMKASGFLDFANDADLRVTKLSYFDAGRWDGGFNEGTDTNITRTGNDFPLVPGKGYLVVAERDTAVKIPSRELNDSVGVLFSSGWNLIGVNGFEENYTAKSLLDSLNQLDSFEYDNVTYWSTSLGRYEGYQNIDGFEYGENYPVLNNLGYFVRSSRLETSSCNGVIWNPGHDSNNLCLGD